MSTPGVTNDTVRYLCFGWYLCMVSLAVLAGLGKVLQMMTNILGNELLLSHSSHVL